MARIFNSEKRFYQKAVFCGLSINHLFVQGRFPVKGLTTSEKTCRGLKNFGT
ncbi:MAG: hypothetical protein FJY09_08075 [Chlorobi bacterium]|nr:hypothetical protein [Chlorobiota bacterium]